MMNEWSINASSTWMMERRKRMMVSLVLVISLASEIMAFVPLLAPTSSSRSTVKLSPQQQPQGPWHPTTSSIGFVVVMKAAKSKKEDDDDEDEEEDNLKKQMAAVGMDQAFRQLSSLDSLLDDDNDKKPSSTSMAPLDDESKTQLLQSSQEPPSLEQEIQVFKGLLEDSERDAVDLYADVLEEMGGTPQEQIQLDEATPTQQILVQETIKPTSMSGSSDMRLPSETETQALLDQAIQEALEEARNMAPSEAARKKLSDSILDDEDIMKEIEEIFERGNEQLLASLEEIRQEQVRYVTSTLFSHTPNPSGSRNIGIYSHHFNCLGPVLSCLVLSCRIVSCCVVVIVVVWKHETIGQNKC